MVSDWYVVIAGLVYVAIMLVWLWKVAGEHV